MTIPIVFIHLGNQEYLYKIVLYARQRSTRVVLLGDQSNIMRGIEHVDLSTLGSPALDEFRTHFVNYSTNNPNLEFLCFSRMFHLREWMVRNSVSTCVHLDSDCILLDHVDTLFKNNVTSYIYPRLERDDPARMAGNVATSCLTIPFLDAFIQLCRDIYVTKTKFHLIQPKIQYHKDHGKPGGICDMTLYYLLSKELTIHNLLDKQEDGSTYDDNINDTLGFDGPKTFSLGSHGIKDLSVVDSKVYARLVSGDVVKLNNLHFQGNNGKKNIEFFVPVIQSRPSSVPQLSWLRR